MDSNTSKAPPTTLQLRKRASKPKVKTGCVLCKARRIKCTEEKPACSQCLRSMKSCVYFQKPMVFVQYRALASATHAEPSDQPSVIRSPKAFLFSNEQESRYFDIFRQRTATTLSAYFATDLWNRIVLQACDFNPGIRACVIAIGALDQTLDSTHQAKITSSNGAWKHQRVDGMLPGFVHHEFALRQYGRAIRQLRESMSKEQPDMRTALIACVLTSCFESLHGDLNSAISQVRHGLKIIRGYLPQGSAGIVSRLESKDETHEVVQFFDRMDNDCVFLQDLEPIEALTGAGPISPRGSMDKMPAAFQSVQEAKTYFEFYLKEFLHWIAYQIGWSYKEKELERRSLTSQVKIPFDEQRAVYLESFAKWKDSFRPLADSCSSVLHDQRAILALSSRFASLDASLGVDHFRGDMEYDNITPQFEEIISLTKQLIESETDGSDFTVDGTIISNAYGVAHKCRNPSVRRQAIEILESRPRREGIGDSPLVAKIARIQMEIEESGMNSGIIPEEARMIGIKISCDAMNHKGQMKYLKKSHTGVFSNHQLEFAW